MQLTEMQLKATQLLDENRIGLLVGAPGVGKTTTLNKTIKGLRAQGKRVSLCAPSGKAAKRMSESTGESATTIHRLLEAQMGDSEFFFKRNETATLDCDVVVCDETSMVGCDLMADLLRAIDPAKTKILFVGDKDQLPSVSPGAVLRDMLNSGKIPTVELKEIFRNAGDIVKSCHRIKNGQTYEPSKALDPEKGLNIRHIEEANPRRIVEIINELVSMRMPARGYNSIWDVQVITPTNSRTAMSCDAINKRLQASLNGDGSVADKIAFRVGDKAIQTKNESVGNEYVVNGDLCQIIDVAEKEIKAKFFDPERIVSFSKSYNHLLLAYAITCHRFQGSEAPVVIIPVHKSFSFLVDRPWIYTAISRARDICITVGQFAAIESAIQKETSAKRKTRLTELVQSGH